jgi:hypothetical protein
MNKILQRAVIARQLPDLLVVYNHDNEHGVCWRDTDRPVNEREWLYVAHQAEKLIGMDEQSRHGKDRILKFCHVLGAICGHGWKGCATHDERIEAVLRVLKLWESDAVLNSEDNLDQSSRSD